MRCPNCGRTNTPERLFCTSCAAELVPEIAEQFEPPRARTRRRRQAQEAAQVIHSGLDRFNTDVSDMESRLRSRDPAEVRRELRRSGLLLAAIVPGLAHLLQGERRMGQRLLLAAIVSGTAWLVFMGSFLGTMGIYSLASLLVTSVIDTARLQPGGRRAPLRLRFVLLGLTLMFLCWMTATQVLAWGWERLTVNMPIRVVGVPGEAGVLFRAGDNVLVYKGAYRRSGPRRGEIICITAEAGGEGLLALERVIGVAGDEVTFQGGKLTVNGQAVPADQNPLQPTNPVQRGEEGGVLHETEYRVVPWSGTVSEGRYLVWGVDLPPNYHDVGANPTLGPREIRPDQIVGKGLVLYSPYSRRRLL